VSQFALISCVSGHEKQGSGGKPDHKGETTMNNLFCQTLASAYQPGASHLPFTCNPRPKTAGKSDKEMIRTSHRALSLVIALVVSGLGAYAQDSCVTNLIPYANTGDLVPYTMVSIATGSGNVTYTTGSLVFAPYGTAGNGADWYGVVGLNNPQLWSNRFPNVYSVPQPFPSWQPFTVLSPEPVNLSVAFDPKYPYTIENGRLVPAPYIWVVITDTSNSAYSASLLNAQCGGPGNRLLVGSDNTAMYVISFGTPSPKFE
jgi:hypothetical protein